MGAKIVHFEHCNLDIDPSFVLCSAVYQRY